MGHNGRNFRIGLTQRTSLVGTRYIVSGSRSDPHCPRPFPLPTSVPIAHVRSHCPRPSPSPASVPIARVRSHCPRPFPSPGSVPIARIRSHCPRPFPSPASVPIARIRSHRPDPSRHGMRMGPLRGRTRYIVSLRRGAKKFMQQVMFCAELCLSDERLFHSTQNPMPKHARSPGRHTIRLREYDYRSSGAYFVTICVKNHACVFGKVYGGKMHLNELGQITHDCWECIPAHFPQVSLDAFVIMPNHMHGIIIIDQDMDGDAGKSFETFGRPAAGSLSTIVRSYKAAVTRNARRAGFSFEWQSRFYEHVIKNSHAFRNIRQYILNNPAKWGWDRFYL